MKKRSKGYVFAFLQVQMAIVALSMIRYSFPPVRSYVSGIVIFFVLLITGSLTFLETRKLAPFLQIVAAFGMLASLAVILTLRPLGEILFEALGARPELRPVFAQAGPVCLPSSPFNILWLVDDMISDAGGHSFLFMLFGPDATPLYYLHAFAGFLFWLLYLFYISADESPEGAAVAAKSSAPLEVSNPPSVSPSSSVSTGSSAVRLEKLRSFYSEQLSRKLIGLEEQRKEVRSRMLQNHGYIGLTLVGCFVFGWNVALRMLAKDNGFALPFFIIIVLWIVALSFYWPYRMYRDKKKYLSNFKKEIVEQLIRFVDPSLSYEPERKIDLADFIAGGIFRTMPSSFEGDDYVSGVVDGRSIAFSELNAQKKMGRNYVKIFRGVYFVINPAKAYSGETYVLSTTGKGPLGRAVTKDRGQRLATGDAAFDEVFTVYTTSTEEATSLLGPEFLKSAVEYQRDRKDPVFFSFLRDKAYIALAYRRPVFEPPIYRTILDFDLITFYFRDLNLALDIAGMSV